MMFKLLVLNNLFKIKDHKKLRMHRSDTIRPNTERRLRGIKFRDLSLAQQFDIADFFNDIKSVPDYYYAWSRSPLAYTKYHVREKFMKDFSQTKINILTEWKSREAAMLWKTSQNSFTASKWLFPLLPENLAMKYRIWLIIKSSIHMSSVSILVVLL